jgi:uncharacterized protein
MVIGASPRSHRYSYTAVKQLQRFGHPVIALGLRKEKIGTIEIITGFPHLKNVDTVTLYVGPQKQPQYYHYLLDVIRPNRIIFNPGTENEELYSLAQEQNIEVVENCTLMMLANGLF